jgi:general stress protein YciG
MFLILFRARLNFPGSSLSALRLHALWRIADRSRTPTVQFFVGGTTPHDEVENLMSNEIKSGNMNDQSGSGNNDPNRTNDGPRSGQQSQGTAPQTDKGTSQQGGSSQKSGQQSQGGGSQKDRDGMKQAGSTNIANDPKKATEAGNKGAASK